MKGFKYVGYISVLYEDYKKVIKRLMFFSPPTKCFYEAFLSNLDKVFSLFWLKFKLLKVGNLSSQIFFWPVLLLL